MPNRPTVIDLRAPKVYTRDINLKFASIGVREPLDTQAVIAALPSRLVGPVAPEEAERASRSLEPKR